MGVAELESTCVQKDLGVLGGQADCEPAMNPGGKAKTGVTLGCSVKSISKGYGR